MFLAEGGLHSGSHHWIGVVRILGFPCGGEAVLRKMHSLLQQNIRSAAIPREEKELQYWWESQF